MHQREILRFSRHWRHSTRKSLRERALLSDAIHDASQNKCVTRGVTPNNSPPSHSFCSLRELGPNDLIIRESKTGYRCQKCTQFAVRPLFFRVKGSSESPQIPAKTGYPKGIRRITWVYGTEGSRWFSVGNSEVQIRFVSATKRSRLADSEMATTAGCRIFRSPEIAKYRSRIESICPRNSTSYCRQI